VEQLLSVEEALGGVAGFNGGGRVWWGRNSAYQNNCPRVKGRVHKL